MNKGLGPLTKKPLTRVSKPAGVGEGLANPEGPNHEKIQDHPPGLKFSSEIETNHIFKRN